MGKLVVFDLQDPEHISRAWSVWVAEKCQIFGSCSIHCNLGHCFPMVLNRPKFSRLADSELPAREPQELDCVVFGEAGATG